MVAMLVNTAVDPISMETFIQMLSGHICVFSCQNRIS